MAQNLDRHLESRLRLMRRIGLNVLKAEVPIGTTSKVYQFVIAPSGHVIQTIVDRAHEVYYLWHCDSQTWRAHNVKGELLSSLT